MRHLQTQEEKILSAGIDIGTSTTKLVISEFSLRNMAGGAHLPRIEIINKKVLYRSPIFRTPLMDANTIDLEKVMAIVKKEYTKANILPQNIKTGAVIITGETATKKNAEQMVHQLSDSAGDFLVATAGPDLEGIIAAKGSGAFEYSKQNRNRVIANIDIGGGTANVAVYKAGKLCGTCTLHVGGRLIEASQGKISKVSRHVKDIMSHLNVVLEVGSRRTYETRKLTNYMADTIARMLKKKLNDLDHHLLLGHEPNWLEPIDTIMFSGGISEYLYKLESDSYDYSHFEDIGEELAKSLLENTELKSWNWVKPEETVRATVLGAGTQTTEISGATIEVSSELLPVKNLPVHEIRIGEHFEKGLKNIPDKMAQAATLYDPNREGQNFAIYLSAMPYLGFRQVQELAAVLCECTEKLEKKLNKPIVVVLQSDHAKVLGQTLKLMNPSRSYICIDQIKVENGDYLDVGQVLGTGVVPVVVKTLTFHH